MTDVSELLGIGLIVSIAVAVAGCTKTERKKEPAPVKQSSYWYPAITVDKLTVPCVPEGTKIIERDTPTIFREKCPKGWKQTNVYYKSPSPETTHD